MKVLMLNGSPRANGNTQIALEEIKKTLEQESEKEEPCSQQAEMASGYEKKICPLCGNELIVRTASRGVRAGKMFFGCKNYPRCKYVENID